MNILLRPNQKRGVDMKKKCIILIFVLALFGVTQVSAFDSVGYNEKINELKNMLLQCENMGMECPYEEMYISTMEQFANGENLNNEDYVAARMDELYTQTKSTLSSYIAGDKTPLLVPKYKTSDIDISGNKLVADTTLGKRPVFFTGYGHFAAAKNAFNVFPKLGANITQQEIGPSAVVFEASKPYGWNVFSSADAVYDISTNYDKNYARGSVSLKIEVTGASGYAAVNQFYKVKPNTTYTCIISAIADSANSIYIMPYSSSDRKYFEISSSFRNYTYTFTTGDETETTFTIVADNAVKAYIDNVTIWESGQSENLINNGNFEKNKNRFGDNNEYIAVTDNIENNIIPMLQSAKENNIAVDLLISPHYFPAFVKNYYPDINIYHRQNRLIMDKFLETMIPMIKDESALKFICLSNEPTSNTSEISSLLPEYRNTLLKKYGSVSEINKAYGKSYTSIEDINMPNVVSETREFYDWMEYNDSKFAKWHSRLADKIKELMPEAKVHSKVQDYFAQNGSIEFERNRLTWGTDAEKFKDFSDLMGNDSYSLFTWQEGRPIQGKLKWYDFLSSLKKAPVYNSEDHIIPDKTTTYSQKMSEYSAADIFQGALHGRYASTIWTWERTNDSSSLYYGNILQRPDALAGIGKVSLDLNRLAYEVTAFNEKKADVAILYSNLEQVYNKNYITIMDAAYDSCLYAGQKVKFVTEKNSEDINNYKVLIVPNVMHADEKLQSAVKQFTNAGKKVIWIGECFTKDEYDNPISFSKTASVSTGTNLKNIIYNAGSNKLKVCLADGSLSDNLEWNVAEYNGKILVNICNYSPNDIEGLRIVYNGKNFILKDLIADENIDNNFTAKSYVPMLISLDTECKVRITDADLKGGFVKVNTENYGNYSENIKIEAKYYEKDGTLRRAGALSRLMNPNETFGGSFSFDVSAGGRVCIEVFDAFNILADYADFDIE